MEKSRVGATQASIGTIKTRCSPSTRVKRMAIGGLALPFGIEETTRLRMLSKRYYASKSFLRRSTKPSGTSLRLHIPATHSELTWDGWGTAQLARSEEHTSELQSLRHLVCRLLL